MTTIAEEGAGRQRAQAMMAGWMRLTRKWPASSPTGLGRGPAADQAGRAAGPADQGRAGRRDGRPPGCARSDPAGCDGGNSRNGKRAMTVSTDIGLVRTAQRWGTA
jgi:hypothetical protein